jgi:hypothetical protein
MRIPFCCEAKEKAAILIGEGGCVPYSAIWVDPVTGDTTYINDPGSGGGAGLGGWGFIEDDDLGCADCFFDRDRGVMKEALMGIDTNADNKADYYIEDPTGCDTLVLFNRNHSATAACGNDGTGNRRWWYIDLFLEPGSQPCAVRFPQNSPSDVLTEAPPGSGIYRIDLSPPTHTPVSGCDSAKVLLCCYNGRVRWQTLDSTQAPIETDSARGEYCESLSKRNLESSRMPRRSLSRTGYLLGEPVPNPTSGKVTIPLVLPAGVDGALRARISAHDMVGRKRFEREQNVNGTTPTVISLDASDWEAGTYIITVDIDGIRLTTQFVLRK